MSMNLQTRIQSEVEKFQNAIHQMLVPLQKKAYLCMADCSDPNLTPQSIERCYKKCQQPIATADNHVQFTIGQFQQGIQNCDMNCQDKPNQSEYESCIGGCADKVLAKFPGQTDELLSKLKSI
mmetsp:Transcript_1177/g.956  ORF Transcript_1177/g.956 Transcript_1177/m.956 type:complete len:123 (+) Transcript_1177:176-544(+)